jgi:hypothetical protein
MMRHSNKQTQSNQHLIVSVALGLSAVLFSSPVLADEKSGPWECSNYSGDAHTRCLQAFVEIQREKISKLEAELQLQQSKVGQLKDQVDRQSSAAADLQRQLADQPPVTYSYATPGAGLYLYPPVGLGLYFGRPWYGPPYYYGRPLFWGPRYHRPYFGRWHRRW